MRVDRREEHKFGSGRRGDRAQLQRARVAPVVWIGKMSFWRWRCDCWALAKIGSATKFGVRWGKAR